MIWMDTNTNTKNKTENRQVHAYVDIKIREITDRNCTCEWINRGMMNEWMDKQISRWMDGWMDGWMDEQTCCIECPQ